MRDDYLQELLYGVELYNQGNYTEAFPHVNKALHLYPQSSKAWSTLGALHYKSGNIKVAKEAFLRAIEINNYYAAYDNMALLLWEHEGVDKTRTFTRQATKLYPRSENLWFYRLLSEYKSGNHDEAFMSAKNYYVLKGDQKSYEIYLRLQNQQPLNIE
jgi:tetratricopeptide (TPR) repeat protein